MIGDIPHCTVAWTLPCCGQHWIFISRHCGNSPDRIKTNTPHHGEPLGYTTHICTTSKEWFELTYCIQVEVVEVERRIRGAIVDLRTRWLSSKCLQSARAIFHYLATSQWSFMWMSVCFNVCYSIFFLSHKNIVLKITLLDFWSNTLVDIASLVLYHHFSSYLRIDRCECLCIKSILLKFCLLELEVPLSLLKFGPVSIWKEIPIDIVAYVVHIEEDPLGK